jgi:hypothetical protein
MILRAQSKLLLNPKHKFSLIVDGSHGRRKRDEELTLEEFAQRMKDEDAENRKTGQSNWWEANRGREDVWRRELENFGRTLQTSQTPRGAGPEQSGSNASTNDPGAAEARTRSRVGKAKRSYEVASHVDLYSPTEGAAEHQQSTGEKDSKGQSTAGKTKTTNRETGKKEGSTQLPEKQQEAAMKRSRAQAEALGNRETASEVSKRTRGGDSFASGYSSDGSGSQPRRPQKRSVFDLSASESEEADEEGGESKRPATRPLLPAEKSKDRVAKEARVHLSPHESQNRFKAASPLERMAPLGLFFTTIPLLSAQPLDRVKAPCWTKLQESRRSRHRRVKQGLRSQLLGQREEVKGGQRILHHSDQKGNRRSLSQVRLQKHKHTSRHSFPHLAAANHRSRRHPLLRASSDKVTMINHPQPNRRELVLEVRRSRALWKPACRLGHDRD